ncbi:RNA recognition motif-type RNA-binding protein [Rhodotorula toruloides]|uniref:RNA recognition motif-type RNA-binding protein n=1 Tax=Rhodotorula toruloides TaxID=5286 RepID=A0A511KDN5_RHOTO|nr:RNA recognition motif-type RNA-binding protein [Rhodotorula toruloides]
MRHGKKLAKLSRPTAHRMLMLRNIVSSVLEHEQIQTTVAKAKAARRLVDQVIGWGKSGTKRDYQRAKGFLLTGDRSIKPLFGHLAERYANRPGGYTRVTRAGNRGGDNAEMAVLELVDGPNDLRFEFAARAIGRDLAIKAQETSDKRVWWDFRERVESQGAEKIGERLMAEETIHPLTRKNAFKALKFRKGTVHVLEENVKAAQGDEAVEAKEGETKEGEKAVSSPLGPTVVEHPATLFLDRAYHHYLTSMATFVLSTASVPDPSRTVKQLTSRLGSMGIKGPPNPVLTVPRSGRVPRAGERTTAWDQTLKNGTMTEATGPISIAKGLYNRVVRRARWKAALATLEAEKGTTLDEKREVQGV